MPIGVFALVVAVSVAVLAVASVMLIDVGLKTPLAPVGRPLVLRLTCPVKPASGVIVTVYAALPVGTTVREAGFTPKSKSGAVDSGAEATNVL